MKNNTVLEALLRPPIEFWSTAMLWGVALIALVSPWVLMMPRQLGWLVALICILFGYWRARQALFVLRYQHGLKYYKVTRVAPHKIPVAAGEFYLGEGFEWTQIHTQRRLDASRSEAEPFVRPSAREVARRQLGTRLKDEAEALEKTGGPAPKGLKRLATAMAKSDAWYSPFNPYPDLGGTPVLHGVGSMNEHPIKMRQSSRNGHMIVMGTTRVGKTRMLEMLATQDIHAGHVTIVIDPKGDAELMLRLYAEAQRAKRGDNFFLFHLGYPEISARYNGIGNFSRITEVAGRATNALPSSGNSAASRNFPGASPTSWRRPSGSWPRAHL